MSQQFTDTVGFGFLLWFIGYLMGFFIITIPGYPEIMMNPMILAPFSLLGGFVTAAFAYIRFRKRAKVNWQYALLLGISWSAVAVILDFIFIVLLFNAQGYYRLHIFIYYAITLVVASASAKYSSQRPAPP